MSIFLQIGLRERTFLSKLIWCLGLAPKMLRAVVVCFECNTGCGKSVVELLHRPIVVGPFTWPAVTSSVVTWAPSGVRALLLVSVLDTRPSGGAGELRAPSRTGRLNSSHKNSSSHSSRNTTLLRVPSFFYKKKSSRARVTIIARTIENRKRRNNYFPKTSFNKLPK